MQTIAVNSLKPCNPIATIFLSYGVPYWKSQNIYHQMKLCYTNISHCEKRFTDVLNKIGVNLLPTTFWYITNKWCPPQNTPGEPLIHRVKSLWQRLLHPDVLQVQKESRPSVLLMFLFNVTAFLNSCHKMSNFWPQQSQKKSVKSWRDRFGAEQC